MTNSDGQSHSRRSSMRFKGDAADEDSDMDSVDSDDLMVMYDSASEGEEGGILEDGAEERSNTQELTRIDKDVEDGLIASDDEDEGAGDAENYTAHTTINEDMEDSQHPSMLPDKSTRSAVKSTKENDDMKIDVSPLGPSNLPTSPSRRYPTRHSFRDSLGDAVVEHAGTSTMRSVSTNMHTTPEQTSSPRSQRYQKRAETRKETIEERQPKEQGTREKQNKECVTVVVKDAR